MKFIKQIIGCIAYICSFIVSHKLLAKIELLGLSFHSQWIRRTFAICGSHCTIEPFSALIGNKHIYLGDNIYVGKEVVWEVYDSYRDQHFSPRLSIGDGSSFGGYGHITCINRVTIGNGVRIGRRVLISDNAHGSSDRDLLDMPANFRPMTSKGPVIIEDYVWIGEGCFIMPNVTIGKGAIVGAGSVVTKSLPAYCVAAGNPARVIKQL